MLLRIDYSYETDIKFSIFIHKGQKHLYEKTDIKNEKSEHIAEEYFYC